MSFSKNFFLFLVLLLTFQTACESQSRAKQTPIKNSTETRSSETVVDSKKQPSPAPSVKPQPTTPKKSEPANAVCGDPAKPCANKDFEFAKWELPFKLPARLVPNKTYSSAPFYAVIVKKYEDGCSELDENPTVEPERVKLQKRFPANKVFAEYSCPNMSAVNYDFSGKLDAAGERFLYMDYIAVYAGEKIEEAEKTRDELKEEFPNAEIKKMTAEFGIIEQ